MRGRHAHDLPSRDLTLLAASLGMVVVQLDVSVVNVAARRLEASFGTGVTGPQWVLNAYTLAFAALLLSAGALGDRLGALRVFTWGFALFTAASLACGLAPTLGLLIAARAVQGVGAALVLPSSLALLSHAYADPAARARAVGVWSASGGLAVAAGPVIGGLLIAGFGWRSIFLVNLPVGAAGIWLTLRHVAPAPRFGGRGFDVAGQLAAVLALCGLSGAIIEAGPLGWGDKRVIGGLTLFAIAGAAFLLVERGGRSPMLPLSLFRRRAFAAATLIGLFVNAALYGVFFVFSLFFQQVQGFSPLRAGLAFLPMTGLILFSNIASGRLAARFGPRPVLCGGLLLAAAGFLAMLPAGAATGYWRITPRMLCIGVGVSLAIPAMTIAMLGSVGRERAGVASGVLNAARQTGGVLGVAVFGALLGSGDAGRFIAGMRVSMLLAAIGLLIGCAAGFAAIPRGQPAAGDVTEARTDAAL